MFQRTFEGRFTEVRTGVSRIFRGGGVEIAWKWNQLLFKSALKILSALLKKNVREFEVFFK